jgi:hypothetical protein
MRRRIEELQVEIAFHEHRYHTFVRIEEEILQSISRHGFAAASQRVRLVGEMQGLGEKIRRNKIMLACERRQISTSESSHHKLPENETHDELVIRSAGRRC